MINRILLAAMGVSFALSSFASDYSWTGEGDQTTWSDPANWGRSAAIAWTAADTATFDRSATVTVDGDIQILKVNVTGEGTEVTLNAASDTVGSLNMTSTSDAGGIVADEGSVLNLDVPVVFSSSKRQELSGEGTVRFLNKYTLKNSTSSYSSLKNVIFSKGAVMDTTANTGTGNLALGISASFEINIRMEEDAELKLSTFNVAKGSTKTKSVTFLQDGANTKVSASGEFIVNNGAENNPIHYVMKSGTLTAMKSLSVASAGGTAGGDFTQEGGSVSVTKDFNLDNGSEAYFKGGSCTIGGALTAVADSDAAYLYNGAKLTVGSLGVPLNLCAGTSEAPAELHFTNAESATYAISDWTFEPGAKLKVTADAAVTLAFEKDSVLPDGLDIGANVTVFVDDDVLLTARDITPPAIAIRNGGHLNLYGGLSYIATPIDLTIDNGGQLWADSVAAGNRGIIVAHSCTTNGVALAVGGRWTAANSATAMFRDSKGSCDMYIPFTWTGAAGDGSMENEGNWENGSHSYFASNAMVDFSRATGSEPIALDYKNSFGYGYAAIAYLPPQGREGTLKIVNGDRGAYNLGLRGVKANWRSVAFCRKGCTMEFDVKVSNYDKKNGIGWFGGGVFRFCREMNVGIANCFLLDGRVEIASTLAPAEVTSMRFFSNHSATDRAVIRFVEGANVTLPDFLTFDNNGEYSAGHAYEQAGGAVTVGALSLSATRPDAKNINTYAQSAGTLTVTDEIRLGGTSLQVPTKAVLPSGTYVLTGGTVDVAKVSLALNQNWCKLQGGFARIGTGGFVKATDVTFSNPQPNDTPGLEFGGVTFEAANSWTADAALDVNLTGTGGATTFDVAAERTVTLAGAVSGVGGFVKTGAGSLTLNGKYSATGDIAISGGTVTFGSVDADTTIGELALANENALSLAAGQTLKVRRLVVGGVRKAVGSYTFGAGTVAVAAPESGYAWINPNGGNWSDAGNWYAGNVPNGEDVELDFFASAAPVTIVVDQAVALKKLALDASTITLATGAGVLSLHDAEVAVADGAELRIAAETHIARVTGTNFTARVQKTGGGRLCLAGFLRSGDEPSGLSFGQGAVLETVAGETEVACEVAGVHVYPLSVDQNVIPTVRLVDGAVMTNAAWLTGTFNPYATNAKRVSSYGAVVMDGGTVAVTKSAIDVFGSNGSGQDASGGYTYSPRNGFAWFYMGSSTFVVNGGSYVVDVFSDTSGVNGCTYMNLNNTTTGGGSSELIVNGGLVSLNNGRSIYFGMQNASRESLNLTGGTLSTSGGLMRTAGSGADVQVSMNLAGGTFEVRGPSDRNVGFNNAGEKPIAVKISGDLTVNVVEPDCTLTFDVPVKGTVDRIAKLGAGALVFADLSELDLQNKIDLDIRAGLLSFGDGGMTFGRIDFTGTAKLGLKFEGTQNADALYVNGRQSGMGVYGTTGRRAGRFVGEGLLNVLTGEEIGGLIIFR